MATKSDLPEIGRVLVDGRYYIDAKDTARSILYIWALINDPAAKDILWALHSDLNKMSKE